MNHPSLRRRLKTATITTALLVAAAASARAQNIATAASTPDFWVLAKPSWLTAASVTAKQGIDSNLFGVSVSPVGEPNVANVSSSFTTISANLTVDLLAASGAQKGAFFTALTLAYAADYTAYSAVAREDNLRNTLTLSLRGKRGPWTLAIDNPFLYVDGSKEDPFYNTYSVLGYAATRERRDQLQERNTSSLRYDTTYGFVRAVANATYYNLLIDEHNPVGAYKGYINWVNRDDINTGLDLGYKVTPDFAFTAGWRIGQQTQGRPYYSLVDNDSTYNRALLGFEGKLRSWLQLQWVGGSDFRRYSDAANPGIAGDRHTWLYTQGQLTATFSPNDSLALSNKIWHWVSSPGLTSFQDTSYLLSYKHAFSSQLSASAGVTELGARYDAPTVRNDWSLSFPLDVTYAFSRHFSASADFANSGGHSHLPASVTPGRSFNDNLGSLSLKASF